MKKYLPALAALALVACEPGAIETGFYDWDGNLIVLYELPDALNP